MEIFALKIACMYITSHFEIAIDVENETTIIREVFIQTKFRVWSG